MRMKKILILAAVVAMSVACSKTYEVNPGVKDGAQISFGSWTEGLTRAEARVQGTNTFLSGDTFKVYGYKYKTSPADTSVVFPGDVVTFDGTKWSYTPPRFWDKNFDYYDFFAVSPSGVVETATAKTGVFGSTTITFTGHDNDVLVADKTTVANANFTSATPVNIPFNHVASLFSLTVRKHSDLDDAEVIIKSVSIDSLKVKGTFAVTSAYTENHPVVNWTVANAADSVADWANANTLGMTSVTIDGTTELRDSDDAAPRDTLIKRLIVMPQQFRETDVKKQIIRITYTVKVGDEAPIWHTDVPVLLREFDDTPNDDTNVSANYITEWTQGKHYIYDILINADKIVFTASINDWTAVVPGYHYLMN